MPDRETRIALFDFLTVARQEPPKQLSEQRVRHFASIYAELGQQQAAEQAQRCIDCGTPYCSWQCPVHNFIPEWLKLVAQGQLIKACELSHQTNSLPEMCGRICPQDKLCEGACTLNDDFGAVTIGVIEQYISDKALAAGWKPDLSKVISRNKKVAIVGAGPAGLACADVLTRNGVKAVVYDKYPEIGGLLTFGIPEFKLEKAIVKRRRQVFESMGIEFILNTTIGDDIGIEQLLKQYDAVFLGLGADKSRIETSSGSQLNGIVYPMPYLIDNIEVIMGLKKQRQFDMQGKDVVVLGAGDTAMDCNRTAIRQGASSVTCIYRQGMADMAGSKKEVKHAIEEGVHFLWHQQVKQFTGTNEVQSVIIEETTKNSQGRVVAQFAGDSREIKADAVIIAYGFDANPPSWLTNLGIERDIKNRVIIDANGATNHPGLFAGGDMVLGADLVVTAIAQGRQAAQGILSKL